MLYLLKIEWLKVKNYRTFWVLLVLYLVSIAGGNYLIYEILKEYLESSLQKNPTDAVIRMMIGNPPYSFPTTWAMTAYVTSYLLIIPGFLTIILFTNEFNFKTHRQNLIDGLTRMQFIASKLLVILVITILSTLVLAITAFAFGAITGKSSFSGEYLHYLSLAFLQCLNYCLLALMMGALFKRSGIALGVYFVYVVIFDNLLFHLLKKYANNTGWYLPIESADNLIPLPLARQMQQQILDRPDTSYILAACLIYISIYVFITIQKFRTDDL